MTNNDEQQPPASSNARRARDEGFGNLFSPRSSLRRTFDDKPLASTLYGSASIWWQNFARVKRRAAEPRSILER